MRVDVLPAVMRAQTGFLAETVEQDVFLSALNDLLQLTSSACGALGECKGRSGVVHILALQEAGAGDGALPTARVSGALLPLSLEAQAVLLQGKPLMGQPAANELAFCTLLSATPGLLQLICLPLQYQGELLGIVLLANANKYYEPILAKKYSPY